MRKFSYLLLILFILSAVPCVAEETGAIDDKAFQKTVSKYRKIVLKEQKNLALHRQMIEAANRANQLRVPLYIYQKSYKKNPTHPIVLYVLGYTHLTKGTEDSLVEAEKYLKQALEQKPDMVDAHAALGRCYLEKGDSELALKELEASIQFNPKFAPAYLDLARYYRSKKEYREAIANYKETLSLDDKSINGHLELGALYLERKNYAAAEQEFLAVLKYDRKLSEAYYKLGQIRAWQNQGEQAIDFYKKGRKYAPNDIAARYELANIFLDVDNGRYAIWALRSALALDHRYANEADKLKDISTVEAANVIEDILKRNPDAPQLQHFLGKLQLKLGDTATAKQHLEKAKELTPTNEDVRANLAEVYEEENEPEKAAAEYKEAAKLGSTQLPVLLRLVDTYRKDGNEEKLVETLEQTLALDPNHPGLHFELAAIYLRQANELEKSGRTVESKQLIAQAIVQSDQAVKLAPSNSQYHLQLANLYAKQGKLKAIREYNEAITLASNNAEGYAGRATFMLNYRFGGPNKALLYRPEDILKDLLKAVQLDPKLAVAQDSLGIIYDRMGYTSKAMEAFEKAVELDETNARAHLYLAEKYANSDHPKEAIKAYSKAIKYDRDNFEALKDFAFLTLRHNEKRGWKDAQDALKRALELNPDDPEALMNYGYTLYLGKKFISAIKNYLRALELAPESAHIRYNLALAYEESGQTVFALQEWRKVLEIDPDSRFGITAQERILELGGKP